MTITLPEPYDLPQTGLAQTLFGGIGKGLEEHSKFQEKQKLLQAKELQKLTTPYGLSEFSREMKGAGFKDTDFSPDQFKILLNKTNELTKKYGRKAASEEVLLNSSRYLSEQQPAESKLSQQVLGQQGTGRPSYEEVPRGKYVGQGKRSLWEDIGLKSFARGLGSGTSGASGAALSGVSFDEYSKETSLPKDANVWDQIQYAIGNFLSDSPAFLLGSHIAGPGGAFALPTFLNSSLQEFMQYKDKGFKGSFEDYLNSVGKVAAETTYSGALGGIFGAVSKVLPIMKAANPAIKSFFEATSKGKVAEFLGKSALQSTALLGSESVAKRELPSKQNVATTLAQVFGLNLMEVGSNKAKGVIERIRRSKNPKGPADTINRVNEAAKEAGIDKEKVASGDKAETDKLYKIVTDITKSYEGKVKEVKPEGVSKEGLEAKRIETKERSEELSKAPLEEYLKEKKVSEGPKVKAEKLRASNELSELNKNISRVEENISKLNNELEKGIKSTKSRVIVEKSKANFENQLEELRAKQKELEYISKKGVKPFSEAETLKTAQERVKRLEDMTRNPKKYTSADWEKEFKGESKYLQDQIDILNRTKGKEPIEPYKDRHIKSLETYNKLYQDAIKNLDNLITKAKGREKAKLTKIQGDLKRNKAINDARLTKHRDKLSSKAAIKNAPALMKHYIQQLKGNLPGMQKPLIEYKKAVEGIEAKTEKVGKEALKDGHNLEKSIINDLKGEKGQEKKIEENLNKVTADTKLEPKERKTILSHLKKAIEIWKSNKGTPDKAIKEMRSIYRDMSLKQRIIVGSVMSASLKGLGVPYWLRLAFIPSGVLERGATTAVGGYILSKVKGMREGYLAAQYKALKTPEERRKRRLELQKKYGNTKANRIMKLTQKIPSEQPSLLRKILDAI